MRLILLLTAFLAVSVWAVVRHLPEDVLAEPALTVSQSREIKGVAIDGGRGLPLSDLRNALGTKVGQTVVMSQLERDRETLEAELAARGFLSAKVAAPSVTYGADGAYVVFDVEKGPMFHLRSVVISGPGQREAAVVTIAAGDPAIQTRITQARQTLVESLSRHGMKTPTVEIMLNQDPDAAAVDVELVTH